MPFGDVYYQQAALLIRAIPHVAQEICFALKGGTAINLFIRNMPRLSVDPPTSSARCRRRTAGFSCRLSEENPIGRSWVCRLSLNSQQSNGGSAISTNSW